MEQNAIDQIRRTHCRTFLSRRSRARRQITGTVTDKTTGKPAAGDKVELVDVQAGMSVAATAKTDSSGRFSLNKPGNGPYLVRVTHQGSPYFVAAPEGSGPADIPVYDAAPNVGGVSIEADVIEVEAENGQAHVTERYFVHNTSSPPRTQYNPGHGFEIVLPPDAVVDGAAARRPTGLPTSTQLKAASEKNHFAVRLPHPARRGRQGHAVPGQLSPALCGRQLHLQAPGTAPCRERRIPPAHEHRVQGPRISVREAGSRKLQTLLAKNVQPGQELTATISGTGSMPREAQGQPTGDAGAQGSQDTSTPGTGPGGGIGQPIGTPDPLTKYKWWILLGMFLGLSAVAGFLLRRPAAAAAAPGVNVALPVPNPAPKTRRAATPAAPAAALPYSAQSAAAPAYSAPPSSPASHNATLLTVLKEELFAIESEKLSGVLSPNDYKEQKSALETVLKRALKKQAS